MKEIRVERTRRHHLPALWERGGGGTNTGHAMIIARPDGEPPRATYIRRRGELACDNHALVVVEPGYYVVEADHHRKDFAITLYRIERIEGEVAVCEPVARFDKGEWDNDPPEALNDAIEAAKSKATCYHCREPHFVI